MLLLIFTVYALIAVEVFGLTRYGIVTFEHANFRDFPSAILTLYRMTTGEAWNKIMHEMTVEYPYCIGNDYTYLLDDCGSAGWAYSIFLSFEVLTTLIFMTLFVVTVIDNFDFTTQEEAMFSLLTSEDFANFKRAWADFDPKGTGYIPKEDVTKFLRQLNGRLEVKIYPEEYSVQTLLRASSKADRDTAVREPANIDVDVRKLNSNVASLDVKESRQKRAAYNFTYHEALSHEEPGKGVPFNKLLRILAYRLIDAEQFLKIDQMFIRQQEMNAIQEKVYREKIRSTFTTIALRRRYCRMVAEKQNEEFNRDLMSHRRVGRDYGSFTPPQSDIPIIVVDVSAEQELDGAQRSSSRRDSIASTTSSTISVNVDEE